MRERKEDMNKDNDAWGVQDEWKNEAQTKDKTPKKNATKHKINMTC